MAKKTPKKYRQAKKAARPAAKAAFPGKTKAVRRDPMAKYSAEDKQIFREIAKESKGRYITDDKGNKIQVKPTETAKERIARERAEAMRKFREEVDADKQAARDERMAKKRQAAIDKQAKDKAARAGKPAPTLQQTAPTVKSQTTKAPAKKAAVKKAAAKPVATTETKKPTVKKTAEKGMTRAEKSAANKAAWKKMTPAERKNWKANKPGAAKPAAAKAPVYSITDVQPEKASKGAKKAKFVQKKTNATVAKTKTAAPKTGGTVAIRPKGTVSVKTKGGKEVVTTRTTAKPVGGTAPKPKSSKLKKFGRGALAFALGAEIVSLAKGSTAKDAAEIIRLRRKLAKLQGNNVPSAANSGKEGAFSAVSQLADLATMGLVGKTRRERMDELNALIKKQEKKNRSKFRYGPQGESLVPGTDAWKKGSKTRPVIPPASSSSAKAPSGGTTGGTTGGAGGSTTKVTPSGTYVVKRGDTLSGIAKAAGVSLAEIRAANKKFAKNPKYKQGNMIWSGTTVKIPKKK